MESLFQLRSKNDKRFKECDEKSREKIRSMVSYLSQYELTRYDIELFRTEILDKTLNSKSFELTELKSYCDAYLKERNLENKSLKNFFLVQFLPMIFLFFIWVVIVIHFISTGLNNTGSWMNVDITLGYPIFMVIQYFSIVFLLYLERRYSLEDKSKKNIASIANIFIVLTVIQFISENELLSSSWISINIFVLVGLMLLLLAWTIYLERQTK